MAPLPGAAVRLGGRWIAGGGEQAGEVSGPADRDGGGADGVFEHEVPTDDPGEEFAEGGVGIGVGAAADGDHGGEFGVAEPDEGAGDAAEHERHHDGRPGIAGGGGPGQDEDAGADDGADADGGDADGAEGFGEWLAVALRLERFDGLARHKSVHRACSCLCLPASGSMGVGRIISDLR